MRFLESFRRKKPTPKYKISVRLLPELDVSEYNVTRRDGKILPESFEIHIGKDDFLSGDERTKQFVAFTHELGHALGKILKLPGNVDYWGVSDGGVNESTIRAEEEAWDVAEKIFFRIKEEALDSYRQAQRPYFLDFFSL